LVSRIRAGLANSPVTALLGPRQCGKSWLARPFAEQRDHFFDLHDFVDRVRLSDSQYRVLDDLEGTIVIDEIQLMPELFPKLRVLADRPDSNARFLITGSASPNIVRGVSESLAGRIRHIPMGGFCLEEDDASRWRRLWMQGGFPRSYLQEIVEESMQWRHDYVQTFLSRDLPLLAETKLSPDQLRRLLLLLAHYHGQAWNHSNAATMIGVSYKTIQRHVEIFLGAYILRELPPYVANVGKRLRKAPRLYLRDSGLLHALLMLPEESHLQAHPCYGASWEGFCIEQIMRMSESRDEECFCFSVSGGEECDLVLAKPSGLYGFEFKASDAPRRTKSMIMAAEDLKLTKLFVVYPGHRDYALGDNIEVVGIENLARIMPLLK